MSSLVAPEWVAAHVDDPGVQVIEVDVAPAGYDGGHVPGAVLWNAYSDLRDPDYRPVDKAGLERLLSRSGVTAQTTIVFHGYGAHLGFWMMQAYGHDRIRLMDGPRERWTDTGRLWSTELPTPAPTSYALPDASAGTLASREAVERIIGDPDVVILDVRSQAEYDGERFWPSGATEGAGRAGHIPGAVHIPIDLLRTENGAFRIARDMRQVLDDHAIRSDERLVIYCTIGNRASQAWFALRHILGYDTVAVYDGSWAEWGTDGRSPIESAHGQRPPRAATS